MENVAAAVPTRREAIAKFIFAVDILQKMLHCVICCFRRGRIQRVAAGHLIAAP